MATQQSSHIANTQIANMMDSSAGDVGRLANGVMNQADSLFPSFQGVDGEAFKDLLQNWVNTAIQIQKGMENIQTSMLTNDGQSVTNQLDNITKIRNDSVFGIMAGS
ncbi:hypothetical protein ACFWP5_16605 [Streptomyces sp. NPDC058469]|uniref:hypothetical protein n=1 Tax=Streptomyces sp. NPDC058469 TaxID=3346514 RepID=UPI003663FEB9